MRPTATLRRDIVRSNVRAYHSEARPVAAVVKADGYGWGAARLAAIVDDLVESYFVSDLVEFRALRQHTGRPIRLFGIVPDDALPGVIAAGGIPNVTTVQALQTVLSALNCGTTARIRLGTIRAAGWSTPDPAAWPALTRALAASGIGVELWTHLVSSERARRLERDLLERKDALERHGVNVVSLDVSSTNALERDAATSRIRIGAGLFGARLGAAVRTRCAIDYDAPVVRRYRAGEIGSAGYGNERVDADVTVVRAGYADGIPRSAGGNGSIVTVGMQFTTLREWRTDDVYRFTGDTTDLDELAAAWDIDPHELIVHLGRPNSTLASV